MQQNIGICQKSRHTLENATIKINMLKINLIIFFKVFMQATIPRSTGLLLHYKKIRDTQQANTHIGPLRPY